MPVKFETVCFLLALTVASSSAAHPGIHHDIEKVSAELAVRPNDVDLLLRRALLLRLNNAPTQALFDLQHVEQLAPQQREVWLQRGQCLSLLRDDAAADAALTKFLSDPHEEGRAAALAERGRVRARLGRQREAVADFDAALALLDMLDVALERAQVLESMERPQEAIKAYRMSLERHHGAVVLRLALIDLLVRQEQFDDALREVDLAAAAATVKTQWLLKRGEVLLASGDEHAARSAHETALMEADRALARRASLLNRRLRAEVLVTLNRDVEAAAELRRVLAVRPDDPGATMLLDKIAAKVARPNAAKAAHSNGEKHR